MKKESTGGQQSGDNPVQIGFEHIPLPSELEEKTFQLLRNKGLIRPLRRSRIAALMSIVLLIMAGFFLTGLAIGKSGAGTSHPISATPSNQSYLLLLRNPPAFQKSETHAREYGEWMRSIARDISITGHELATTNWQLQFRDETVDIEQGIVPAPAGYVSGFFILQARDEKQALEIASSCPHLRHRGTIELRPVRIR